MSKNKLNKTIVINGESYHLNKMIPADAKSEHHILGRMNRLQYNTNEKINKVLISDRKHQALNRFFQQSQSPIPPGGYWTSDKYSYDIGLAVEEGYGYFQGLALSGAIMYPIRLFLNV